MNELLRVPFDFCVPTVKVEIEKVQCIDFKGRENHVLLMHIEPSMEVHANQADEVFMRVGNKSKKLAFEERMQLMYDKGERFFEDKPVPEADIEDIDFQIYSLYDAFAMNSLCRKIYCSNRLFQDSNGIFEGK